MFIKNRSKNKVRKYLSQSLKILAILQSMLFDTYLKQDYIQNRMYYERKIFQKRVQLLKVLLYVQTLQKTPEEKKLFFKIEHLIEIVFSVHQLRFRVRDFSVWAVCAPELNGLQVASAQALLAFSQERIKNPQHSQLASREGLLERIQEFETVYQRALQVVVAAPIVFLFFIQDLYALYDELFGK